MIMIALKFIGVMSFILVVYAGIIWLICRAKYDGCYTPGISDVQDGGE